MEEQRKGKRLSTANYCKNNGVSPECQFKIIVGKSAQVVGYLVDISPGGMRIIGKEPVTEGTVTELVVEFPEEIKHCLELYNKCGNIKPITSLRGN